MTEGLRSLLIPPQEARLRSRFGLDGVPLQLITSGWHRLVVAAPDRVFVFPRHQGEVPMLEREADVLSVLDLDFAPRLLGLHQDDRISPYCGVTTRALVRRLPPCPRPRAHSNSR